MSVMEREEPDPYGGIAPGQGPPQGQPQPSSSSVYNMPVGNRSQTAMATGSAPHQHAQAPRSHSMHNTGGRPQMTPVNTSQLPSVFPEPLTETPTSADYTRMMGQMSMSGRGTPGPLDDIAGIPDRSSGDLGALKGPWEQQSEWQRCAVGRVPRAV
jgi:hypothetical protein